MHQLGELDELLDDLDRTGRRGTQLVGDVTQVDHDAGRRQTDVLPAFECGHAEPGRQGLHLGRAGEERAAVGDCRRDRQVGVGGE